jgi:hypothetical protein
MFMPRLNSYSFQRLASIDKKVDVKFVRYSDGASGRYAAPFETSCAGKGEFRVRICCWPARRLAPEISHPGVGWSGQRLRKNSLPRFTGQGVVWTDRLSLRA